MQQQMDSCITASKEFPLFLLVQYTLEENNWQTFKRHLKETLLSSNVDPMGSPPKVPLWQLCQETNTFFRLLVASNHQVGDQMIKKRHLALAETTRESRQRGIAMTMSSLKKRKNHLNKSYPPKQSPILMLLWIMQKTPAALAKNLAMSATIAFSPIGPSTRSGRTCRPWSATCYPLHALRQCKWVTKTARCVVQKAYTFPYRIPWCLGCSRKRNDIVTTLNAF